MMKKLILATVCLALAPLSQAQLLLEEVVVTAQKREQNLQDVGISVTAFSGEQLRTLGYTNAQQITALAPGVSTVQPNGEANYALAIRGAANSDFIANQESPVSLYVDEVYISQLSGAGFQLFDLERVEILRGPQGTLFGRNATGGLAHYISRKPEQEFGGYAQVTVGNYDQIKTQGAINGGLTEQLSARLSWATHHNSGYVKNRLDPKNDLNNANDYAGRLQLLYEADEDLSVLFNARYSLQEIRTGFFENLGSTVANGVGVLTTASPTVTNFNGYFDADGDVFAGDYDKPGHNDLETYGFTATVKWNVGFAELTSITDYQSVERDYIEDSDASPFNDFNFFLTTDAQQYSQEIRLNGETENFKWVTGFYYLDIDISDSNGAEIALAGLGGDGLINGVPSGTDTPYDQDKKSWSLFGQVEYDLTKQFTLIGGFRYIDEDVDFSLTQNSVLFNNDGRVERGGNPNIRENIATYSNNYSKGLWSAKAQLDYRPNDDWLFYGSWNRGVKGGGFNAPLDVTATATIAPDTPEFLAQFDFGEETVDAFEIGFKSTLWGGLARWNTAVFYSDYKDFQAFTIVGLVTNVVSAPDASNKGFESELFISPAEGLDIAAGVGYVDNQVTLADGQKVTSIQTPKWNLNGLIRYQKPTIGDGTIAIQGDIHYRSKHFFSLTNANASTENGYYVANIRLSWASPDEKWEVAAFVDNVTNEEYLVQTFDLATVLGFTEGYYGRPRWLGASVNYNF